MPVRLRHRNLEDPQEAQRVLRRATTEMTQLFGQMDEFWSVQLQIARDTDNRSLLRIAQENQAELRRLSRQVQTMPDLKGHIRSLAREAENREWEKRREEQRLLREARRADAS